MTDTTRRSLVAVTGAIVVGSLAGCTSVTSSDEPTETTGGTTASVTESSPIETTTDGASSHTETTTGDGSDQRTTRGNAHAGALSIINDTNKPKTFIVTITNDSTGETRTFERTISAGKQEEIPDAYPITDEGIVTHTTTIESDGTVLGKHDVRVFDYHKVHDVTATVTASNVEWNTVVH